MMIKTITTIAIMGLLVACSARHADPEKRKFDSICSRLDLSETTISHLYGFKTTASDDRIPHVTPVYDFLRLHQLLRGNNGPPADSEKLTESDTATLLGPYDATDKDGNWIYYFKTSKSDSLRLEFKDGYFDLPP